ncbi:hypothetical protein D3C81_1613520 [compost metagenome]
MAEPSAKVTSTTTSKLMPIRRAVSPSCATARMAMPKRVRVINRWTPMMMATPAASRIRLSARSVNAPNDSSVVGSSAGNGFGFDPSG